MHSYQSRLPHRPGSLRLVKALTIAVTLIILARCVFMAAQGLPQVLAQGCALRAEVQAATAKPPIQDQGV